MVALVGLVPLTGLGGCYQGEFLVGQPCERDDECGVRSFCDAGLCGGRIAERGPEIDLLRPTDLQLDGEGELTAVVDYFGMVFADPSQPAERWPFAHGSVALRIDEEVVGHVVRGDGETDARTATSGQAVAAVDVPPAVLSTPGLYRLDAEALDLDGAGWDGDNARDDALFWVRDGQPRVAFASPVDGARAPRTRPLTVLASVADFALIPPLPDDAPTPADPASDAGQVAVFVHQDVPECLPGCSVDDALVRVGAGFGGGGSSREIAFELTPSVLSPIAAERERVTVVLALVDQAGAFVRDPTDTPVTARVDLVWE